MWNDAQFDGESRRGLRSRGPLFVFSLLGHGLVVAAVVVGPLLTASSGMAPLRPAAWVRLAPPAPPPPPAGGGGRKRLVRTPETPAPKPTAWTPARFVAPFEVPDKIEEENLDKLLPGGDGTGPEIYGPGDGPGPGGPGFDPGPVIDPDAPGERISRAARLVRKVAPFYPRLAIESRTQGVVIVEASTDIFGKVRAARIVSGHPLLNDAALQAVRQWIFEPYLINGIPRAVTFTVTVTFSLNQP